MIRSFGASASNTERSGTTAAHLRSHIGDGAYAPGFPMIHEQLPKNNLQKTVIVLAHVALLDASIHEVAVRPVTGMKILFNRHKRLE